jgi:hypothetical protein
MSGNPIRVFLDANVIIQAGKPPGGPILARVVDLVKGGFIEVLTTDLTKTEVAKKHAMNDLDVVKDISRSHFRNIVRDITGIELPSLTKQDLFESLLKRFADETDKMFSALGATTLLVDTVMPSTVFNDYAKGSGFFSGEGKKHQFPDAFIFACLKAEASKERHIIIVSDDGDFLGPSSAEENISILKSIPELFTQFDLRVDAPNIVSFLQAKHHDALMLLDAELKDWGLQASDVEDAEIDETTVTDADFVELIAFGKATESNDILVIGRVKIKANVSYTHPDWNSAAYDSEDKVLVPFEDVSGETEIETEADFSMSILADHDGNPVKIEEVRFTNDKFIWVELHPYDPYEYM